MALDAMIFDIDGTLVDTNRTHAEAWRRAFERHGYTIPLDRIEPEIGKGGDNLVPAILGERANDCDGKALRESAVEEFLALAEQERFELIPGAAELIERLRSLGIRTALATSASEKHLDAILGGAAVDVREIVDEIVTADDAESSKPDPDIVLAAVRKLGLSPAQCAMVGDTPHDAEACRRAGVVLLGVLTGGHAASELIGAGARATWRDTGDLLDHLDEALTTASPGTMHLTSDLLERLMRTALDVAREGMEHGEAPIGAVLARGDGTVIARAHNRVKGDRNKIAHAEILAFMQAAGTIPLDARDLILVSTLEPCVMCTGAAMAGAVDTIIYGMRAPADSGTDRVRPPRSPENQMPRIVGDILADESRTLFEEWLHRGDGDPQQIAYVRQLLALT